MKINIPTQNRPLNTHHINLKKRLSKEKGKLIFFLLSFLLAGFILVTLPRLTIPLGLSYVLFLIVSPALPVLLKFRIRRDASIMIIFLGLSFFTVYPVVKIYPLIQAEVINLQQTIPKIENYLRTNYREYGQKITKMTSIPVEDKYLEEGFLMARKVIKDLVLYLPNLMASFLEWLILVPFFLFFLLKDGKNMRHGILKMTPNVLFERFYFLSHEFNRKLGDYIFAKFVEATIVGIIITAGLYFLDVRFAVILGIVAGVTNIVPYLGPVLGAIAPIVVGLVEHGVGPTFGGIVILLLVANVVDLALVFPILVSKIVDLHPLVVVISVILGSQVMGVIGMVISIPMAAALKLLFIEIYKEIYSNPLR